MLHKLDEISHGQRKTIGKSAENFVALRDRPEGAAAEAYRSLRANLKFILSNGDDIRSLAFTSSTPGEGKSMTTIDMAIAFGRDEKRVLLVDGDMRKPTVHKYLGLQLGPGFSDVLQGRANWRERDGLRA